MIMGNLKNRSNTKMPWLLFAFAFVFMFNPNLTIIDVLPDFIGYILISVALSRPSMVCETLADAKKAFEKMILVDGCKYIAIMWVFGIDALSERASSLLLWSFVFAVLEAIFLVPAYIKLFKGLSEVGDYFSNTSIHGTKRGRGKSFTDKIKIFTIFFVLFKAFMCVLPELADFTNLSGFEASPSVNLYRYIGVIRFLCCIPVVIIGLIWLAAIVKYFVRIAKDKPFNTAISEHYATNILPRKGLFITKHVRAASWLFVVGAILSLDFKLEGVNLLPDILVIAFIIPAFIYFCKTAKLNKIGTYISAAFYGVFVVLSTVIDRIYFSNYASYNALNGDTTAFVLYTAYVISVALQGLCFVLMVSSVVNQIGTVIAYNTGYVVGKEINTEGEKKRIEELHRELNKGFSWVLNFAVFYVITDVLYSMYGAIYAFLRRDFGFFGIINFAFGLLFVGAVIRALGDLKEAVKTKYMLE